MPRTEKGPKSSPKTGSSEDPKHFHGIRMRPSGHYSAGYGGMGSSERFYLGTFNTAEEAARAYDKKALQILGDKAQLNFPIDPAKDLQAERVAAGRGRRVPSSRPAVTQRDLEASLKRVEDEKRRIADELKQKEEEVICLQGKLQQECQARKELRQDICAQSKKLKEIESSQKKEIDTLRHDLHAAFEKLKMDTDSEIERGLKSIRKFCGS